MVTPIHGAFDQGVAPTISAVWKATNPNPAFETMVSALQKFITNCFAPFWGTPATITAVKEIMQESWGLVFLDDADVANALGYHDLTPEGYPLSKVFVKTLEQSGESVSVTASHEIAEMLVDPGVNMWYSDNAGQLWAGETADAVEEQDFDIDGYRMSNFVLPAYFEPFRAPKSRKFDFMGRVSHPFEIMPGGYSIVITSTGEMKQLFGSREKQERFEKEDRRQHRTEYRSNPANSDVGLT
jgi:hypothetical protein